jgi:hypothetical protein
VTNTTQGTDSGLMLYAVVRADHIVPDGLVGLDDNPVELLTHGGLGAVVGEFTLDRPPGRRQDLTAYTRVVDALPAGGPVAPFRFGTVMPDARAVVDDVLGAQEQALGELLESLDGQIQYNLRATYVEDAVLAEIVEGDQRIRELRERTRALPEDLQDAGLRDRIRLGELVSHQWERLAHADADTLLAELSPTLTAHVLRREPGAEAVLDAALLVAVDRSQEVEDLLERLAADSHGRLRLRLVGPVAPYDFVGTS